MAVATILAIEIDMAIVSVLAIETDMAIVIVLVIETDMAIVTNIPLSGIKPGIKSKEVCHRIASLAPVIDAEVAKLPLVFWGFSFRLGILSCVVTILVAVETGDMTQVIASSTGSVGRVDTGGWVGVLPSLLLTTMFLSLLPSFLVGGFAILGPQKMWAREMWAQGVWVQGVGACLEPFWRAPPKDHKLTRPGTWPR